MPLNLIFVTSGNYTIGDDGIPGNNTSVIRDGTGAVIFTFAHPADSLGITTSVPGVNVTVDFADPLGAATFTMGSLTDPAASFSSIAMDSVRTTGAVTLVSNGRIGESGIDSGADIIAGSLLMSAVSGIAAAAKGIETEASVFEAETGTGGINVSNFGSVQIGGASDGISGLDVATSGNIRFSTVGTILLADATGQQTVHGGTSSGNVALTAIGFDSDIIASTDLDAIAAAGGNIVLKAGRDIGFGIIGTDFDNDVRARGSITINAGRDFLVDGFSDIASDDFGGNAGGNLVVNAGRNIHLRNVAGTDGSLLAGGSGGADVILTSGSGGSVILDAPTSGAVSSFSGNVIVNTDHVLIAGASGITASAGQVVMATATAGGEIHLGSAGDTGFALKLSDTELDRVFTPSLVIGNNATGRLTVSSAITPASAQNLVLRSGEDIAVQAAITTSGSLTLRAGDNVFMASSPVITVGGALSIFVDTVGNDGGAGGHFNGNLASVSAASIAISGAEGNDTLGGFEGVAQTLHGNGGKDRIISSGEGRYFADAGNDLMLAGLSSGLVPEVLNGGAGRDKLDTTNFSGSYTIRLATGVTNFDFERFVNFENVLTGGGGDHIVGTAGKNVIDTGAGDDRLDGKDGNDVLRGGVGADTFVFKTGYDQDTIVLFENGLDKIDVSGWTAVANFNDLKTNHASNHGDDVWIEAGKDRLVIKDTQKSDLDAGDFTF